MFVRHLRTPAVERPCTTHISLHPSIGVSARLEESTSIAQSIWAVLLAIAGTNCYSWCHTR
jgi:hypothetical protein